MPVPLRLLRRLRRIYRRRGLRGVLRYGAHGAQQSPWLLMGAAASVAATGMFIGADRAGILPGAKPPAAIAGPAVGTGEDPRGRVLGEQIRREGPAVTGVLNLIFDPPSTYIQGIGGVPCQPGHTGRVGVPVRILVDTVPTEGVTRVGLNFGGTTSISLGPENDWTTTIDPSMDLPCPAVGSALSWISEVFVFDAITGGEKAFGVPTGGAFTFSVVD